MKKTKKNNDVKSVLRWIALLPALAVTWYTVAMASVEVESWMFSIPEMKPGQALASVIVTFIILPSVAMFFMAKFIAPKYKKISGMCAVGLCVLWVACLFYVFYGLGHMAY